MTKESFKIPEEPIGDKKEKEKKKQTEIKVTSKGNVILEKEWEQIKKRRLETDEWRQE